MREAKSQFRHTLRTGVRRVALMIESTGISVDDGHRVVEIGAVELIDSKLTGRCFHVFLDPERDIDLGAESVHGLSSEFLKGKPKFAEIAESFLAFISYSELITHRAEFHVDFIESELARISLQSLAATCMNVSDTLSMARRRYPEQSNNLYSLCERLEINRSRVSTPEDATLVALCYLAMQVQVTT